MIRLSIAVAALLATSALAVPVAQAHHADACDANFINYCTGTWDVPNTVNPAWWNTSGTLYSHGNQPVWIHLETDDNDTSPFEIDLTVRGNAVGSVDVYKVYHGDSVYTDRKITPDCPQDYAAELYPQGDESLGDSAHRHRVQRLTLESHQTVAAPDGALGGQATAHVEVPRNQEWVVVIDARSGTGQADSLLSIDSEIKYEIRVDNLDFHASKLRAPDEPVDTDTWEANQGQCATYVPTP